MLIISQEKWQINTFATNLEAFHRFLQNCNNIYILVNNKNKVFTTTFNLVLKNKQLKILVFMGGFYAKSKFKYFR